jgi:hypothetical protein
MVVVAFLATSARGDPAKLESQVLTVQIPELLQSVTERLDSRLKRGGSRSARHEDADPVYLPWVLRLDGEWRGKEGKRAAEQGPSTHHSIT